jgi:hypothetical protein
LFIVPRLVWRKPIMLGNPNDKSTKPSRFRRGI